MKCYFTNQFHLLVSFFNTNLFFFFFFFFGGVMGNVLNFEITFTGNNISIGNNNKIHKKMSSLYWVVNRFFKLFPFFFLLFKMCYNNNITNFRKLPNSALSYTCLNYVCLYLTEIQSQNPFRFNFQSVNLLLLSLKLTLVRDPFFVTLRLRRFL